MIGMNNVHISCKTRIIAPRKTNILSLDFSCAFHNTPKFTQVHQSGSGAIVNKQWILDCYEQKRLLPEKNYQLTGSKSETPTRRQTKVIRLDDEEDEPKISTSVQRKTPTRKTITTFDDDDEDEDEEPIQTRAAAKKRMVSFDDDDDEDDDEDQALTSKGVARKTPSTRRTTTSSEMDDGECRIFPVPFLGDLTLILD